MIWKRKPKQKWENCGKEKNKKNWIISSWDHFWLSCRTHLSSLWSRIPRCHKWLGSQFHLLLHSHGVVQLHASSIWDIVFPYLSLLLPSCTIVLAVPTNYEIRFFTVLKRVSSNHPLAFLTMFFIANMIFVYWQMLKIQWEEQQQSLKGNTKKFVIAIKKKKKDHSNFGDK